MRTRLVSGLCIFPTGLFSLASADARILQLPQQTEESRAAAQEMAKHLKTAPPPKMGRIPKKPKGQVSTLDSLLGDGMADTTSQHNSHFYDSNCSICAGKAKEKAEKEKREIEEREKFREQERQRKEVRNWAIHLLLISSYRRIDMEEERRQVTMRRNGN